jgi:Tol biopolymer transport system component
MAPISSFDHVQIAFLVRDAQQPAANMVWVNVQDLTPGAVDFSGIGTPTRMAWGPGRNDLLLVAVQQASGLSNLYYLNTTTIDVIGPIFPADLEPSSVDAIVPSPTTTLVALQTTRGDGNTDTWMIDTNDQSAPNLVNVGPNQGNDQDVFAGWSPSGDALLVRSGPDASMLFITNMSAAAVQLDPNPFYSGDPRAGTAPSWSPDATLVAFFDNDPAAGGQLHIVRTDGSPLCDPIANIQTAVWTPQGPQLWTLMNSPDAPQSLTVINADCSQQQITTFDSPAERLQWDPNGGSLAIVDYGDGEASLIVLAGDSLIPIDMAKANVAFADILSWSPGGDALAIYAGGTTVSLWVVIPGSDAPASVAGSTLPDGATFVTDVWWP